MRYPQPAVGAYLWRALEQIGTAIVVMQLALFLLMWSDRMQLLSMPSFYLWLLFKERLLTQHPLQSRGFRFANQVSGVLEEEYIQYIFLCYKFVRPLQNAFGFSSLSDPSFLEKFCWSIIPGLSNKLQCDTVDEHYMNNSLACFARNKSNILYGKGIDLGHVFYMVLELTLDLNYEKYRKRVGED